MEAFEDAVSRIEKRLGLEGQPRAIVFHEKEGRRHAHCVWSRIDAETMTARPMSFFKRKLNGLSRELYLEHGWKMPRGLESPAERNPTNFSLAEWQQAKRVGFDPRWLKQVAQTCWETADNLKAFRSSLEDRGLSLARGDRRGIVVLDFNGEVYSLPRLLNRKTAEVRGRFGDGVNLQTVGQALQQIGDRMRPALRRHIAESRARFEERFNPLNQTRHEMTTQHRQAREQLSLVQALEWDIETSSRVARLPKGLRGLWDRLTGKYREIRQQNEREAAQSRERQSNERQTLFNRQSEERSALQDKIKELRRDQAEQLLTLRQEIGRFMRFSNPDRAAQTQDIRVGLKVER